MKKLILLQWLFCLSWPVIANGANSVSPSMVAATYEFRILAERSHKPTLFTQGLVLGEGVFYESSGHYGRSLLVSYPQTEPLQKWAQLTAPFLQKEVLPARYFAEGLTLLGDKLYLLTWQEGTLFIYDRASFKLEKQWHYSGEGWGLTHNGQALIRSDGSHRLYFHNTENFAVTTTLAVTENKHPVIRLNELEYMDNAIWANVWHENRIIEIDPASGVVKGSLDLTELAAQVDVKNSESVLNGIAYDAQKKALWVTGKNWPVMYLIQIIKPNIDK